MKSIYEMDPIFLNEASRAVWPAKYPITLSVTPTDGAQDEAEIPSNTSFLCQRITGSFTTLSDGDDVGVNQLSMKLFDTGKSLPQFQNFIDCNLILTPGRVRSAGVTGDPGQQLFYPDEFIHVFEKTSKIQVQARSIATSDTNILKLCFHGYNFVIDPATGVPMISIIRKKFGLSE